MKNVYMQLEKFLVDLLKERVDQVKKQFLASRLIDRPIRPFLLMVFEMKSKLLVWL